MLKSAFFILLASTAAKAAPLANSCLTLAEKAAIAVESVQIANSPDPTVGREGDFKVRNLSKGNVSVRMTLASTVNDAAGAYPYYVDYNVIMANHGLSCSIVSVTSLGGNY